MTGRLGVVLLAAAAAAAAAAAGGAAALSFPEEQCDGVCPPGWELAAVPGDGVEVRECRLCADGMFNLGLGNTQCFACPSRGFDCRGGLAFVRPNFWPYLEPATAATRAGPGESRVADAAGNLYLLGALRCKEAACDGAAGDEPLELAPEGGALAGPAVCAAGRPPFEGNTLCGACEAGLSEWNGRCRACDADRDAWIVVAVAVASLAWTCALHALVNQKRHAATPYLKIVLFFVTSIRLTVGREQYWMSWLGVLDLDPVYAVSSRSCLWDTSDDATPGARMLLESLLPVVFYAQLALVYLADYAGERLYYHCLCTVAPHPAFRFPHSRYARTAAAAALLGYSSWTLGAARFASCAPAAGDLVVFESPAVSCDSDAYLRRLAAPLVTLLAVGAGVPAAVLAVVCRLRARGGQLLRRTVGPVGALSSRPRRFRMRAGFAYDAYHHSRYWWELVVLALRALLVLVAVLLAPYPAYRSQAVVAVHGLALLLQAAARPFATPLANLASAVTLASAAAAAAALAGYETHAEVPGGAFALVGVCTFAPLAGLAAVYVLRERRELADWWKPQEMVRRQLERAGDLELVPAKGAWPVADDALLLRPVGSDPTHELAQRYRATDGDLGGGGLELPPSRAMGSSSVGAYDVDAFDEDGDY